MSTFPSLPLFVDAWVADTKHLTRLARGTYHDLLVLMWRSPKCRVPNDDAWLGKHLDLTVKEIKRELRPIIGEFCQNDGNWITQKRLLKERRFVARKRPPRSDPRKSLKNKSTTYANPTSAGEVPPRSDPRKSLGHNDFANAPTPTPTPTKKERKRDARAREEKYHGKQKPTLRDAIAQLGQSAAEDLRRADEYERLAREAERLDQEGSADVVRLLPHRRRS